MIKTVLTYYLVAFLVAIIIAFLIKGRTHIKSIWDHTVSLVILAFVVGIVGWIIQVLTSIELFAARTLFIDLLVIAGGIFVFLLGVEVGNLLEMKIR